MMKTRQKRLLKDIAREVVRLDWEVAFDGKAYGNRHLFRVNKIAKFLQNREGGVEFIILASAWVHDVSLAHGRDDNPHKIIKHTKRFLSKYDELSKNEVDSIVECAAGHERGGTDLGLEAQIVHDADVIDKSGMLGIIRHTWKMTNMIEERVLDKTKDLDQIANHLMEREQKVFTETAKSITCYLNNRTRNKLFDDREFFRMIIPFISKKAKNGETSDKIARLIVIKYNHPSVKLLKVQLGCTHLEKF